MIRNLKALGLGLLAVFAMSALAAPTASASELNHTGGHFTNDAPGGHAFLTGTESGAHRTVLTAFGSTVSCTGTTYHGTVAAATVTQVQVTPTYGTQCWSGAHEGAPNATVTMNGCTYLFTIRQTNASTKHSPVHLKCPVGKKAEVIVSGCTITFGEQQITSAATYTTTVENGKHALTVDITATGIVYEKHGLCTFIAPGGTGPHTGATLSGSVTLTGKDAAGNFVNITATGTNGL